MNSIHLTTYMKKLYTSPIYTFKFLQAALPLFLLCFISTSLWAQPLEVTNDPPITSENLITNVFLGEGVEVIDVQYDGVDQAVGFFKNGMDEVGIDRGIVMTTGYAVTQGFFTGVDNPGSGFANVDNFSGATDPDLLEIADGSAINNVSKYTITFIPIADTLRFSYAFASEEYPEFVCSDFNDIFGFFISGPGINGDFENNGENIALIPGTDLPVTINNVNPGQVGSSGTPINCTPPFGSLDYSEFYNDNEGSNMFPVYDGITDVFVAEAVVIPCQTYTIKLVICDVADQNWDSGVFLEAKSFGTGSLQVETVTASLDGSIAEGCGEGVLSFSLPTRVESDFPIDYSIIGTAENGIDYVTIPEDLFIPAGDSVVSVPIIAIEDGIPDDQETLLIDVQRDPCNRDTFTIIIRDNPLVPPDLGPDQEICASSEVQLDGTLNVPLPEPPAFSNTTPLVVPSLGGPVFSDINVQGVVPSVLGPDVIKSICIDSLEHRWIDDLDIFLISPGGQFLELSTDNGGDGGNLLGVDYYLNTCFTTEATEQISAPGPQAPPSAVPFTGDWLPEGVWSDLWDSENPTNGTWRLQLSDDAFGLDGLLMSWTICFNPVYEISYEWFPTDGLSCADCPDPIASPSQTTTYYMTATDSYGCTVMDSITIEVIPAVEAPMIDCGTITNNSISVTWNDVPGAMGYEVNINGAGWIPANGNLEHTVDGLSLSEMIDVEVRGIGDCPGFIGTISCSTPDCTPPEGTVDLVNASCSGAADGMVTVNITNGMGPFTYTLNGETNDTGIFTGLDADSYTVEVLDAVSCPLSLQFDIEEAVSLEVEPVIMQQVSCNGLTDGTATVTLTGGTQPYAFLWEDMSTDSINSSLNAGMHSLTITDFNGCEAVQMLEITQPEVLELVLTSEAVSCNGAADGLAIATVTGGTGTYTYQWNDLQQTDTAFALSGGMYEVQVMDENMCSVTGMIEVPETEAIELTTDFTDAACFEEASGSASVLAEGGASNFTYLWSNGAETPDINDVEAGDYFVVVTDAENCFDTAFVTIGQPTALDYMLQTGNPNCAEGADGRADIIPLGGTPDYTITWSDIGVGPDSRNDLSAGAYQVTITDANDCELELDFLLSDPDAITMTFTSNPTSCFSASDGTATAQPIGGDGNYTFLWEDGQETATASDLPPGMIGVTVTDGNGCTGESSVEIIGASSIELEISGTEPSCNGEANGMASVTANGGTGDYSYAWSNGDTDDTAEGLSAGIYEVTVTDINDCDAVINITLNEPEELTATTSFTMVGCNGATDGTASVSVEGGTEPYTYTWNDGQNEATATELIAGNYTVTITDAQNCELIETVEVTSPSSVVVQISGTDVSCFGGNDGQILVEVEGGTGTYTYAWSDPSIPTIANPQTLEAGNYVVTVSDENGCQETAEISLAQPDILAADFRVTSVSCYGDSDGSITLEVLGGTGLYSFDWNTGETQSFIDGLTARNYFVEVSDENDCAVNLEIIVPQPDPIDINLEVTDVECFGQATGAISSRVEGGTASYDYAWSNGEQSPNLENINSGSYTLQITDTNGCTEEETIDVEQPDAPLTADLYAEDVTCYGGRDGLVLVEPKGGTPPYQYSINGEPFSGSSSFIGLEAGDYSIRVQDGNGCDYLTDEITVAEPDELMLDLGTTITLNFGQVVTLDPSIIGENGSVTFDWAPKDSTVLSCFTCRNPTVTVDNQTNISLVVTDENGCQAQDFITVAVRRNRSVEVPTGFTPNGDGMNERLLVHGVAGTKVLLFRIYDRWGELIHESGDFEVNDPTNGWDGNFRNKMMSGGVYIWYLEVEYIDGVQEAFQGSTTLIR